MLVAQVNEARDAENSKLMLRFVNNVVMTVNYGRRRKMWDACDVGNDSVGIEISQKQTVDHCRLAQPCLT